MSGHPTTTEQAVAIDTRLAELHNEAWNLNERRSTALDHLHHLVGDRRFNPGSRFMKGRWQKSDDEVTATGPEQIVLHDRRTFTDTLAKLADIIAALADIHDEQNKLEAIYEANPWPRFFLCLANGGHVHDTLNCRTLRIDTQMTWLPALSGRTEADAVAEMGPALCTVCYPTAPVEYTGGELHSTREEREARQADRAAKADAKLAKRLEAALFDGDPDRFIKVELDRIATIRSAKMWLKQAAIYRQSMGRDHNYYPADKVNEVAEALAARTGTTVEAVRAEADKKAATAIRKGNW